MGSGAVMAERIEWDGRAVATQTQNVPAPAAPTASVATRRLSSRQVDRPITDSGPHCQRARRYSIHAARGCPRQHTTALPSRIQDGLEPGDGRGDQAQ